MLLAAVPLSIALILLGSAKFTPGRGVSEFRSRNLYVRYGPDFAVAGTNFGHPAHPAGTVNLLAEPAAVIEIGPERIGVTAELADAATYSRVWPRFLPVYPGYAHYADRRDSRRARRRRHPAFPIFGWLEIGYLPD